MRTDQFDFPNAAGQQLTALLQQPTGEPRGYALFAHCFTCSKDSRAARRIAESLAGRGIAVLRFDFTGLGSSEGEFANTDVLVQRRRSGGGRRPPAGHPQRACPADRTQPRRGGHAGRGIPDPRGASRRDHRRPVGSLARDQPVRRAHPSHPGVRRGRGGTRRPGLPDPAGLPRRRRRATPARRGGHVAQGTARHARAHRPGGLDRQRGRHLHRRQTPEEFRVPRRRRSSAVPTARCRLRRRRDRRVVAALPAATRRGRTGRRHRRRRGRASPKPAAAPSSSRSPSAGTDCWPTNRSRSAVWTVGPHPTICCWPPWERARR